MPERTAARVSATASKALLRDAVVAERKLELTYRDGSDVETVRIVRPIGVIYHLDCVMLAAWCELRQAIRHFRADRIYRCAPLDEYFTGQGATLRALWMEHDELLPASPG